MRLLIRGAEIPNVGLRDVRCEGGYVSAVAQALEPLASERVLDAKGGALVPGLIDHHAHLYATAAARASLNCAPSVISNAETLAAALKQFPGDDWIRGYGFHEILCADLGRVWLDKHGPERPIRIQHQSGKLWILNSLALQVLGIDASQQLPRGVERDVSGELSGHVYDLDAWLGARLSRQRPSLSALSAELARYGVTALTDAGVENDEDDAAAMAQAFDCGDLIQRVQLMGNERLHPLHGTIEGFITVGPLKIYLRETQLPPFEALVERIRGSHDVGRPVAAHCVTRVELIFMLSALMEAGVIKGDRIEHASVADNDALEMMATLGLTVVTQPHFIAERGDRYLHDVDADDVPFLYRGKGFLDYGIGLAAGSDGPYGLIDPWASMRAAVSRQTRGGTVMAASECLNAQEAFALFCGSLDNPAGGYQPVASGAIAEVWMLKASWSAVLNSLDSRQVRATICRGRVVYDA